MARKRREERTKGKRIRPIVATDDKGLYHAGIRNWSEASNANARDALYHPMKAQHLDYAIERAEHMCKVEVERHRELNKLVSGHRRGAAEKYGASQVNHQAEKHGRGLKH